MGDTKPLPGLNPLRAIAAGMVVLLHAGVPYTVAPMRGLVWPVDRSVSSLLVDGIFWALALCVMPLFFTISGYCAAGSLRHRGNREFLVSRWRRIGRPFLAAAVVLLPLELYVWLIGWAGAGRIPLRKLQSLNLGPLHDGLWGFSHLWYLEYLLLLSIGLAGWFTWRQRRASNSLLIVPLPVPGHAGRLWGDLMGCVMATSVVLTISPETLTGFQHGFLPFPAKFALAAVFFAFGVRLNQQPACQRMSPRHALLAGVGCLMLAGIAFSASLPLIHQQAEASPRLLIRLQLGVLLASYAALVTLGCWLALAMQTWRGEAAWNELARASFWVYLVHHPLVGLIHIALRETMLTADARFLITASLTLGLSLASYEVLVRRTAIGHFLEGNRTTPVAPTSTREQRQRAA